MAKKKSRVPTPPKRPVQAPKAYRAPRDPRRTRLLFIAVAIAIVVAAAIVGLAMAVGGGGREEEGAFGPCTRETFADQLIGKKRSHYETKPKNFEYNSFPPTSGPHHFSPAIWNFYDRPVPEFNLVHNLEHGGVIIQYGSGVPDATVSKIADLYAEDPRGLVVAPLPRLGGKIALTAWTHLMTCSDYDEEAFSDFISDFRGPDADAPEKFELDALQPGGT